MEVSTDDITIRVVSLINEAYDQQTDKDKVKILQQVQELVIHHDILDNFLDEVMNFQAEHSVEVRKFIIGFIEASVKKDGDCFAKLIVNLNFLINDENPNVVKKAIQSTTQIYKAFMLWVVKVKISEDILSTWEVWNQIKETISKHLDDSNNEGVKFQCVMFLESIVLLQTSPDQFSTTNEDDVHLDKLTNCKLWSVKELNDEAIQAFDQLVIFHGTPHIQSGTLMACMTCLVVVARQRSNLFMSKAIQALEALHANLPPTLSNMQVNSVRKHLKLQLLNLLKHPTAATNTDHQTIIVEVLQDLGATQSDIKKSILEVQKKGIKVELVSHQPKKIKLERDDTKSKEETPAVVAPKITRTDALTAIDVTAEDIFSKLQSKDNVAELLVISLQSLPDIMPAHFNSAYTPISSAGQESQIKHLARLLASQLTQAGLGRGVEEFMKKMSEAESNLAQQEEQGQRIATLVGMSICQEANRQEGHHHSSLGRQHSAHDASRIKLVPSGKPGQSLTKVKHFSLQEITKELDEITAEKMVLSAVERILKNCHPMSKTQTEHRRRIISHLCSTYADTGIDVQELIVAYVLDDARTRCDLLLDIINDRFEICQKSGDTTGYSQTIHSVILSMAERTEMKDRDYVLYRLYLESPSLPSECLMFLNHYITSDVYTIAPSQPFTIICDLIKKKPAIRKEALSKLLMLSIASKIEVRELALKELKIVHGTYEDDIKRQIEEFAFDILKYLTSDSPPEVFSAGWTDDTIKVCLAPFLTILTNESRLLHDLARIYTDINLADIKRVILRSLEIPIRSISMSSPEFLEVVEKCPEGAETLITRIVHVMTDREQPTVDLVSKVRTLYQTRGSDVRILIPVLNGLLKKEIIEILPKLIKLNQIVVKEVFNRLLGIHSLNESSTTFVRPLTPAELLVALHNIDPKVCDIKIVIKATGLCFSERNVYTHEVLAIVMGQLIEQNPLPTLMMRTVIQSLSSYPRLLGFVMNILHKLILKQVWKQKKVWEGFVMCCQRTKPQSFHVLMQLPPTQLKNLFSTHPEFKIEFQHFLASVPDQQRFPIPQGILDIIYGQDENMSMDTHSARQPVNHT